MSIKEFCVALARKYKPGDDISALASDFEWLVECADMNAEYGYGAKYLFEHNATARELIAYDEKFTDAVLSCGLVGWAKCAEDNDCMQEAMKKALA